MTQEQAGRTGWALVACAMIAAGSAGLRAGQVQTGEWTGTVTATNGEPLEATFAVSGSAGQIGISLSVAGGTLDVLDVDTTVDGISFTLGSGTGARCSLDRQDDGGYAGTCVDARGAAAPITMRPPGAAGRAPVDGPGGPESDPIRTLVDRLDLERYKETLRGLTQFGDRQAGTDRNRAAIDWIENRLRGYGCEAERLVYTVPLEAALYLSSTGGSLRRWGNQNRTGVNRDPSAQPDVRLRELNAQPTAVGRREEVYCTKIGSTRPDEMYIVSAHMDGLGFGEAANDDGSGTALVMELARVLNRADVRTERSIRFAFWNDEEGGLLGSHAYVAQRRALQGVEAPAGSGRYPEPRWLGVIQHDMLLFDHGMPRADGTLSTEQRLEADINVEFQVNSRLADQSQALAWALRAANEGYAASYPVTVGSHMGSTDSVSFQGWTAAVSVRENERSAQIGAGWSPHWHQPTDLFTTYSDDDFRLGLNAAQTTLAAVARLAGATVAP